jgi:hypothetical protein
MHPWRSTEIARVGFIELRAVAKPGTPVEYPPRFKILKIRGPHQSSTLSEFHPRWCGSRISVTIPGSPSEAHFHPYIFLFLVRNHRYAMLAGSMADGRPAALRLGLLTKHPTPTATGFPSTSSYYRHDETKDNGRNFKLAGSKETTNAGRF